MNQRHDFVAHRHASVSTKARGDESSNVPTEPKPKAPPAPGPAPDLVPIDPQVPQPLDPSEEKNPFGDPVKPPPGP